MNASEPAQNSAERGGKARRIAAFALLLLFALTLAAASLWYARKDIANRVIASELKKLDLPVTYEVTEIGTGRQILRNIVVGNPQRPDLTIAQAEVQTKLGWGMPELGQITLRGARLFGSYHQGKLSFGSLDPLLFDPKKPAQGLPDLDVAIFDGRGRIDSDFGALGIKLEGAGALRDGFVGTLAAVGPDLRASGCTAKGASLFGKIATADARLKFDGPLRIAGLYCRKQGFALGATTTNIAATLDPKFDGAEAALNVLAGKAKLGGVGIAGTDATMRIVWRDKRLTAAIKADGRAIHTQQASAGTIAVDADFRADDTFDQMELSGTVDGKNFRLGDGLDRALADAQSSGADTLAEPVLAQIRSALQREARGSSLSAQFTLRSSGGSGAASTLVVPQAIMRGGSGSALLAVSRMQATLGNSGVLHLGGNFTTGGAGLPRIAGRLERRAGGELRSRLTMADYAAGTARLALPQMLLVQKANGALGFAGSARISGDLPGGRAQGLVLPIDGNWSPRDGLAMWRKCVPVRFDSLALANLTLEHRAVTLCPAGGSAIVRSGAQGLRIAAGMPSLNVEGRLGSTPIRIVSGPLGIAVPGIIKARALDIALGGGADPSKFRIDNLSAKVGKDIAGSFSNSDIFLSAVPLDLFGAAGQWRYSGGRLSISGGNFRLEDREVDDRFQPLIARDATLILADGRITADAMLREPKSDRAIAATHIIHDIESGVGGADLNVADIRFDRQLQPDTLSRLTLGVIANADGVVKGSGRIDWTHDTVSSTGDFNTDNFDFAAAFGPVKGVSGTVHFTDLIGLVTAPDQRLKIASINPGIEANDGEMSFELRPEGILAVNGAHWPFLDGSLTLDPSTMVLGASEVRRFTLQIEGLDAAKFVARLEMNNINATGSFDGKLPLVFDENGGRIESGVLISRPPGGNVSYVGALSYQDLSPMANFAFDALKSIDYKAMRIDMNGSLEGEIIARVGFDGISQGTGARSNFITRQIAKLPIRFNVNLRAPFFRLVSSFRSLYDATYITDPRVLGLVDKDGKAVSAPVQPPASENAP